MTALWRLRPLTYLPALTVALALAGCSDEQILYSVPSPEPIPETPSQPTAPAVGHPATVGGQPVSTAELIPAPERVRFATKELGEPLRDLQRAGLAFPVPARYRSTESLSRMRVAQFDVPHREGADSVPGEFIVFYFGEDEGGGVMDNAVRWSEQFRPGADGGPPLVRFVQDRVGGLEVSRITLEGTYAPASMGPMSPAILPDAQENWAMDALIVEGGPVGSVYIRLTGPADLVRAESDIMEGIAARIRADRDGQAAPPAADTTSTLSSPLPEGFLPVAAPGIAFPIPEDWEQRPPSSSMRAAEFVIPGSAPGQEGEAILFHFGPQGSGPTAENIDRWIAMVRRPDGSSARDRALVTESRHGPLRATTVRVEGTYSPSAAAPGGTAGPPRENYALHGIVVDGGREGPVYLRVTGPAETIRAQEEALETLLNGLAPR